MVSPIFKLCRVDPIWPHGPLIDPRGQFGDLRGSESGAFRRHAHFFVVSADEVDQLAGRGVARDDVRFVKLTAFESGLANIKPQSRFLLLRPVAIVAVLGKDRLDVANEIHGLRCSREFSNDTENSDSNI